MRHPISFLPALFFAPALAFAAQTQPGNDEALISPAQPDTLVEAIRDAGYRATRETDESGDPMIRARVDGSHYQVYFYGCSNGTDCKSVLFSVSFELDAPLPLESINDWNRHKLVGRAFIDNDGDAVLDYMINIPFGTSPESFRDTLDWWGIAVREYKDFIGF